MIREPIVGKLEELYEPVRIKDADDLGSNPSSNTPFTEIARARLERRAVLRGFVSTAVVAGMGNTLTSKIALAAAGSASTLGFQSIPQTITENHAIAPGYTAEVLIRWGDKLLPGAPEFDPMSQTGDAQAKQFGYNCDYLAYFPLPRGSDNSEHGVLHVNHEYTSQELMFPGWAKLDAGPPAAAAAADAARTKAVGEGKTAEEAEKAAKAAGETARVEAIGKASLAAQTPEQTRVEMMAHNGSMIEVKKENGRWTVVPDSKYARRITLDTPMQISGPAAGHDRMKTNYDPTGSKVFGTINNCAGGKTPWGTVLMAEENFHGYFGGGDPAAMPEAATYKRYGVSDSPVYAWYRSVDRFDLAKEPNEPNRYGWMVEYDPYDPSSEPVKRTALGRCKHEGATSFVNKDGRVVFYSGDDERFEYLYRFVTAGTYDPGNPEANKDLLDQGTLYVAKFDESKVAWLPLVFGQGKLTEANGFKSQADVLIETRRAADLVGATPMDRPEDVQPNPVNGRVYVMLTNNTRASRSRWTRSTRGPATRTARWWSWCPRAATVPTPTTPPTSSAGTCSSLAATRSRPTAVRSTTRRPRPGCRRATIVPSTSRGACGSRPTRAGCRRRTRSPTACSPATWRAMGGRCSNSSSRARSGQRCAGRSSPRTAGRCSWPSSTRPRRTAMSRPTRSRPPAGRTSRRACHRGLRS